LKTGALFGLSKSNSRIKVAVEKYPQIFGALECLSNYRLDVHTKKRLKPNSVTSIVAAR
jgi:hypothetical protein